MIKNILIYLSLKFLFLNGFKNSEHCLNILADTNSQFQFEENEEFALCSASKNFDFININDICLTSNDINRINFNVGCFGEKIECKKQIQLFGACETFDVDKDDELSCLNLKIDQICIHFENYFSETINVIPKFNYTECVLNRKIIVESILRFKFGKKFCILPKNDILLTSTSHLELNEKNKISFGMYIN